MKTDAVLQNAELSELQDQIQNLKSRIEGLEQSAPSDRVSLVVLSGDMDRLIASFMIATGAAAMGTHVSMFFTFWGLQCMIDGSKKGAKKTWLSRLLCLFLSKGPDSVKLSQMNFGGMGPYMMKGIMKRHNVPSIREFIALAAELGVQINICETSMNLLGFQMEEMLDYPNLGCVGVASFLDEAQSSKTTLFI